MTEKVNIEKAIEDFVAEGEEKMSKAEKYVKEKTEELDPFRCRRCNILPEALYNNHRVTGGWYCDYCDPAMNCGTYPECADDCSWCYGSCEPSPNIPREPKTN